METIISITAATVKARANGCDNRGVIAETDSGKTYCLFNMGAVHGFNQIAEGYKSDIGRAIDSFGPAEKIFEVERKTSRTGKTYYVAVVDQY